MSIKRDEPVQYLDEVNARIAQWNDRKQKPLPAKSTVLPGTVEPTVAPKSVPVEQSPSVPVNVPPVSADGHDCDKSAQVQKPNEPPPSPPPVFQQVPPLPPAATDLATVAETVVPVTPPPNPPPNPVDTDSTTPHAAPPVAPAVNSTALESAPASRLAAVASISGGPVPPVAATPPSGGQQGVISASLQLTLPAAPSGRTGKKGAWKTTPYKPRKTLPPQVLRTHCVSVRLSADELARLTTDMHAQHKKELAAVLRDAYLNGPRPLVPAVNVDKWVELAHTLSNLNQIATHLNAGHLPEDFRPLLDKLARQFHVFRAELLGQKGAK